ncbi:guanine nucleotide-binding protein G(I)/G(S)/G(O) subunit gamma-12-like [Megalops cyprinoides]|uniref:guanine nucleotide-binding protein G(I)/G(S)/G(O) subunit gamma-12-like n=1 Tax=Megalops cyprinoides TaxID=118141 RepID=UPI001864E627|nr:guanine nucleotide-binding protein G(I)/G(S)/G(O) subunit gamma-12-like [Megalops cyprinoides]
MSGKGCTSNSVVQARRVLEQLRVEAGMERIKISIAASQLVQYCQEHSRSDPLLTGIATSANPFKDKKTCVLL